MVDIKSTSNITRFSTPINEGSKRKYTLMKEDYITLKFSVDNPVYFKLGDYVDEPFGLFELVDLCKPTLNELTGGYDYELRLDAYYWKWKNKRFFYSPEVGGSEAGWNLTATLDVHLGGFLRNLVALGYKYREEDFQWIIDETVENSAKLVQYDNTNLIDALTKMAETWECEWWIENNQIRFGRCEYGDPVDFEIHNNVSSMSRSDSKTSYATRIYAFGSSRNIPTTYRKNLIFDVKEASGHSISDTSRKLDIKFFPESAKIEAPKIQVTFNHNPGQGYFTTNPATYTKDWSIANSLNAGTYKISPKRLYVSGIKGGAGNLLGAYKATLSLLYSVNGEEKSVLLQSKEGESNGTNEYEAAFTECSFVLEKDASNCRLSINTSITFFGSDVNVAFWIRCDAIVQCVYNAANITVTFLSGANKGQTFDSVFNPDFLTKDAANVIMLPEGTIASVGDTYTIDNIISPKVPDSYFSKSNAELAVEGVVTTRLMLPSGIDHVDAYEDMSQEEAIEDIVIFEDVYPRRVGTMEEVTPYPYEETTKEDGKDPVIEKWNAYRFKDTGLTFSKDYVLPGKDLKIKFESGALNGMTFQVWFNPFDEEKGETQKPENNPDGSWNKDAQIFEIRRNEDYGRALPDEVMKPRGKGLNPDGTTYEGDKYVLEGFDPEFVLDTMIPKAEAELLEKAQKYVEKSKIDPSTYECKMNSIDTYNDGKPKLYELGDQVNLINKAYFEVGRKSRIIGYEYNLDIPYDKPIYTVGETAAYSRLAALEEKVDSLAYKGQTYTGNVAVGSSGVYLITSNDKTQPTDRNALSSKRALQESLSKTSPDETKFLTKFLGGLISKGGIDTDSITTLNLLVQELATIYDLEVTHVATMFRTIVKDYVSSETFIPGLMGEGMKIYKALNGDWNLEIDNVVIRKVMTIFELVVSKIRSVNGGLVISSANGRIKSVAETTGDPAYYVLGIEGDNQFVADDLVRCQVFTSGQAKYYWVAVASVTDDSILVLKSEFADGVAPAPGDDLIQMGNRTNKDRQGFLYLTASEDGKPRFSVMDGVDSTSTVGKSKVILGCLDGMTDTDFPADFQPSGWGLYAMNVFLKGVFLLRNGKSVESEIESAKSDAQTAKDKADTITRLFQEFTVAGGLFESKITEVKEYAKDKANTAKNEAINDAAGKYNTKSEIDTIISQTKYAINLSVTEKISNVQVGGRNLALESKGHFAGTEYGEVCWLHLSAPLVIGEPYILSYKSNNTVATLSWSVTDSVNSWENRQVFLNENSFAAAYNSKAVLIWAENPTEKFDIYDVKLERGNKSTDWTPAPEDVQTQITANAAAIEVNSRGISLKASQEQVNGIGNRLTTAEASIAPDAIRLTVQSQTIEYANLAAKLAGAKMLYRDPTFKEGFNGINFYNNSGNGTVTIERVTAYPDNPTDSEYQIKLTSNGYSMQPGRGGFHFANYVHVYGEYICKFIAWIPVGSNVGFASNSIGDGGYQKWLTPTAGQGKWVEYVSYVRGGTANTSTTNFYFLDGGAETLNWYLCYATVFECSSAEDTPTRSELKAGINITAGALNIFGQAISLVGAVTFTSLDGDSRNRIISAQNTANAASGAAGTAQSAANEAWNKADNLKNSLGGLAYDNAVTLAKLDSTIIEGGYIKTNLINARSIVTGVLSAEAVTATNLTVTGSSKVGDFRINGGSLSAEHTPAVIGFIYNGNSASLGAGSLIVDKYNTGYAIRVNGGAGLVRMDIDTFEVIAKGGMSVTNTNGTALAVNGKIIVNGSYGATRSFVVSSGWIDGGKADIDLAIVNGLIVSVTYRR